MKFLGRFDRKVLIVDYVTETYTEEVELNFDVKTKREHTLAMVLAGVLAEEAVLYKIYNREYITKELYAARLHIMIKEVETAYSLIDSDNTDTRLKLLAEGFVNRKEK